MQPSKSSKDKRVWVWEVQHCNEPTKHFRVLQAASAHRSYVRHCTAGCKACGQLQGLGVQHASIWELALYCMLDFEGRWKVEGKVRVYGGYATEVKLLQLPAHFGAVDVLLLDWGLGIMVDGEHHFPKASRGMHSRSSIQQQSNDLLSDLGVLGVMVGHVRSPGAGYQPQLRGVVRLHYQDVEQWHSKIQEGCECCLSGSMQPFVLYTRSYCFPPSN